MEGFQHRTDVRVRFAETDAQGVVHHANYLVWFELARVEFLERFAGGYQRLRDQGIESLLVEAKVRFINPARFDDRLRRPLPLPRGTRGAVQVRVRGRARRDAARGGLHRACDGRRRDDAADADTAVARRRYCSARSPGVGGSVGVVAAGGVFGSTLGFGFGFGFGFGPMSTICGLDTYFE